MVRFFLAGGKRRKHVFFFFFELWNFDIIFLGSLAILLVALETSSVSGVSFDE